MIRPVLHLALAATVAAATLLGCDTGSEGGTQGNTAPPVGEETKSSAAVSMGEAPKVEPDPTATPDPQAKPAGDTAAPGATLPAANEEVAVLDTTQGRIILKFFPKIAPNHVENFKKLAKKGFYDGVKFHRVIPGFMIQGGDPYSKSGAGPVGTGGPGYSVKAEFNSIKHKRGILSAARSSDPDSAGSQFFIMHADSPSLDGQYSAYGQVVQGMDVVDKIVNLPRDAQDMPTPTEAVMKTVKIVKWPVK
ncbi:MAG: peptidylprolyl isomerase [Fimbriimonas sp.]